VNRRRAAVRYNGAVAVRAIGRYRVVRLLGTGGFATVYLACDERLDTDVAVKVLADNWSHDAEITRRFVEEARLLRRCDDDRVVRVHTIEELDDGRPYFVMDYADAGTLADRMLAHVDNGTRYDLREALALSCELGDCLTVVHDCGIVHRDLKPSNVLFRTSRAGERMVLGDFGLARQLLTATGKTILAGTPEYVAPEQADPARAGAVDERADVYAAAVMFYELVAGGVPFDYSTLDQAASARRAPPDLSLVRPEAPPALAAVVARGMASDRADRFPSGRAWLAALQGLEPLLAPGPARPPPVAGRVLPPVPPGPDPAPPPASPPPGAPPPSVPPPAAPDGARARRRKPLWPLLAGILGALALIAAIAVVIGRGGSSPQTAPPPAPGSPSTAAGAAPAATPPSSAPGATAPPVSAPPVGGPAAWFAAASGPTCRTAVAAEKLPGTVSAVTCTYPGVVAVFARLGSPAEADLFLTRLRQKHVNATPETWAGGRAVAYGAATQASLGWVYTEEPYAALAVSDNRTTLTDWWVATGRVERSGG